MVLGVHIPSDAQLTEEKLADSYGKMEDFYRTYGDKLCMAGKPTAVLCGSWLLSPRLRELLPEDSGIRRFAADYELFTADPASEDFYQWLFGGKRRLSELPEETSLQKAVKKYLRGGGNIGSAAGIYRKGLRL